MKPRPFPAFDRRPAKLMAVFGSVGFTIVGASLLGFMAGLWLDGRLQTTPLFTILLLLAGFIAAVVNVFLRIKQKKNND